VVADFARSVAPLSSLRVTALGKYCTGVDDSGRADLAGIQEHQPGPGGKLQLPGQAGTIDL
jgi:hypothetical protein